MSELGADSPLRQASLFGDADALGYGSGRVYDETVTGTGRLRPHWQALIARLAPHDAAQMAERRDEARRLLSQNGVTYTIYGDPHGAERLWPLDLIPLLIPAEEWQMIEHGAIQRARLLNALLADLYGPQTLVASGALPPALLDANPGFLRPCHGIAPRGGVYLHLCAIDLARGPDGRWWALADRTEAPSGAGYALENRNVVGRVLADCLASDPVRPLAPFFSSLREGLAALAPAATSARGRSPRVVLLSPGRYNETYFEHSYLARHLGITLVEGSDLTLRDRHVFLRTVGALEPVDVILRRLDDSFCDPLELRPESTLGVAGLTEAVRAGNVTLANALGSGAVQAAAFKPFLPGLSRALLGEELVLPDAATWWCGGEEELRYVLDHLPELVIKPAFPALGMEPVFAGELAAAARAALAARIAARPLDFVGQERVALSNAPVWSEERMQPRPLVLRVFVATSDDGAVVMPGGLTRTAPTAEKHVVSMQFGGGSKDTWVLAPAPAAAASAPHRDRVNVVSLPETSARRPAAGELPSRAADGLFWVGRYAERTDGVVHLLRTLLLGLTDATQPLSLRDAEPLLNLAAWLEIVPPLDLAHAPVGDLITRVSDALADPSNGHSVYANIQHLLRAAANVRDRLPADCWRAIMAFENHAPLPGNRPSPVRLLLQLDEMVTLGAALWGTVEETMPRDAGWRFLEIGKRLERAIHLIAIIRGTPGAAARADHDGVFSRRLEEQRLLAAILALTGACGVVDDQPDGLLSRAAVLDAVLDNGSDPQSLAFQLASLASHVQALPMPSANAGAAAGQELYERALGIAKVAQRMIPEAIAAVCPPGYRGRGAAPALRDAFARLDLLLPDVSNLLTQAYFTHAFARPA